MKKIYAMAFATLLSQQVAANTDDSVFSWGAWNQGIKPAAGQTMKVTPPAARQIDLSFRPNENSAFLRDVTATAKAAVVNIPTPVPTPQVPSIIITTVGTPTGNSSSLNTGGAL